MERHAPSKKLPHSNINITIFYLLDVTVRARLGVALPLSLDRPGQADEYIIPAKRPLSLRSATETTFALQEQPVDTPIAVVDDDGNTVGHIDGVRFRF